MFDGKRLGKSKLVLAIIQKFVKDHPAATVDRLKKLFPDELVSNYGVISDAAKARARSTDKKRYFTGKDQVIGVGNRKIAVTNQITSMNLPPILRAAKAAGYSARPATR